MGPKTRSLIGLATLAGAIYAFAPDGVQREHEALPPVPSPIAPGMLVVDLVDGADLDDLEAVEADIGADLDWVHELSIDEGLAIGHVDDMSAAMAALADNPLVEVAEPELQMRAYGWQPNDPMYDKQWHLRQMGAPDGWSMTRRGEGVIVAVVDTGVTKVEDLEGTEILKGATFVPGTKTAADDQGHGTHVAGTIAQTTNNGIGVAGVAPNATIMPVKVLSSMGFGSSSWIASGIDYAADNGAQVINLSLGGGYSLVIHNAIRKARKKGVIVVAAAGNSGREGVGYPGALKETIGVSATGPGGYLAPYSSWGKGVDIAAPGGDKKKKGGGVWQDTIDGKGGHVYAEYQGTSMATPHVAGAAAVLLSHGVAPDAVERKLLDTAKGSGSWDPKMGHGQLDLNAALQGSVNKFGMLRFVLGALLALLITQLASNRARFRMTSAALGGAVGGGLFFLHWLPIPENTLFSLLASGFLEWPAVLLGPTWMHFPLWLSALIPGAVALTIGAFRQGRPFAMGLCSGVAAALAHGAATGSLDPWLMPAPLDVAWLVGNASICVILGMALAGAQKLEEEGRA